MSEAAEREFLSVLADLLEERRDAILQRWREEVQSDPQLDAAENLTRQEFLDNIPGALDGFVESLRSGKPNGHMRDSVAQHGHHRWKQGFSLRELVRDWGHLHTVLMMEIAGFGSAQGGSEAAIVAHRALAKFVTDSMSGSVRQFDRMRQHEAASLVEDLERLQEGQAAALKGRARLIRDFVHDMRGSLSTIKGASDLLAAGKALKDFTPVCSALENSVGAVLRMLDDLLDLTRIEADREEVELEWIKIGELTSELDAMFQPLARKKGLDLAFQPEGEDSAALEVETDARKLHRILQNLIVNSIEYTARGGVRVEWSIVNDARWSLRIRDTGPGLQSEFGSLIAHDIDRPEEKVTDDEGQEGKTHAAWTGEGVGLTIVKRLCEMLDIAITLVSEPGNGSDFILTLPRDYHYRR